MLIFYRPLSSQRLVEEYTQESHHSGQSQLIERFGARGRDEHSWHRKNQSLELEKVCFSTAHVLYRFCVWGARCRKAIHNKSAAAAMTQQIE